MSASGYKQTCGEVRQRVRFTPVSRHSRGQKSALDRPGGHPAVHPQPPCGPKAYRATFLRGVRRRRRLRCPPGVGSGSPSHPHQRPSGAPSGEPWPPWRTMGTPRLTSGLPPASDVPGTLPGSIKRSPGRSVHRFPAGPLRAGDYRSTSRPYPSLHPRQRQPKKEAPPLWCWKCVVKRQRSVR